MLLWVTVAVVVATAQLDIFSLFATILRKPKSDIFLKCSDQPELQTLYLIKQPGTTEHFTNIKEAQKCTFLLSVIEKKTVIYFDVKLQTTPKPIYASVQFHVFWSI